MAIPADSAGTLLSFPRPGSWHVNAERRDAGMNRDRAQPYSNGERATTF